MYLCILILANWLFAISRWHSFELYDFITKKLRNQTFNTFPFKTR